MFEDYQNLVNSIEKFVKSEDNPYFKSKYVPLKAILPVIKAHCKENNFIFIQHPDIAGDKNVLVTKLVHKSGEKIEGCIELATEQHNPQKLGAAVTYMRRYSLTCMLGIEEDDDDGNFASGNDKPQGNAPGAPVMRLIKEKGVDVDKLQKQLGKDITKLTRQECRDLEAKLKQMPNKGEAPF